LEKAENTLSVVVLGGVENNNYTAAAASSSSSSFFEIHQSIIVRVTMAKSEFLWDRITVHHTVIQYVLVSEKESCHAMSSSISCRKGIRNSIFNY
jgi:hypothetical protein